MLFTFHFTHHWLNTYTRNGALLSVSFRCCAIWLPVFLIVKGIQLSTPSNRTTLLSMARRSLNEGKLVNYNSLIGCFRNACVSFWEFFLWCFEICTYVDWFNGTLMITLHAVNDSSAFNLILILECRHPRGEVVICANYYSGSICGFWYHCKLNYLRSVA